MRNSESEGESRDSVENEGLLGRNSGERLMMAEAIDPRWTAEVGVAGVGVVGDSGVVGLATGVLASGGVWKTSSSPVVIMLDLCEAERCEILLSGLSTVMRDCMLLAGLSVAVLEVAVELSRSTPLAFGFAVEAVD